MTKFSGWCVGVAAVIAAFVIDWRAAGLMFVGAYLNNALKEDGK